ncbi:restriction endonuclease subunit S [Acinetobacter radioresistens]|uniref:restriction endonuclease subunit S n=1 Tax=Acinetobacter radioresistens TaxID=40216 RepID=UPI00249E1A79|nr:restriction endonuclease subunit S [Acinetobacter radioresistens]MCK4086617.1 restriction endonuclease subunit S [Acinetobacter radioresistens]
MLEEIGQIVTGKTPSSNVIGAFSSSGIPFVTPKDMDGRRWIETTERYLSEAGRQSLKNYLVPKDSVAVSCIGSDMGKAILLKKDSVTNQQINTIIVDASKHNPKYIYYVLSLKQEELKSIAGGSATPILNKGHFSKVVIELPDKVDQDNIVQVLDSLDCKIELNNQINQNLESMAQAIFKSWFIDFEPVRAKIAAKQEGKDTELAAMCAISGKSEEELQQMAEDDFAELQATAALFPDELVESELGEVPKGWEITNINAVTASIFSGGTPSTKEMTYWNGEIPWLSSGETRNKIIVSTEKSITEIAVKKSSTKLAIFGDILIASAGQGHTRGQTSFNAIECYINQSIVALRANDKVSSYWLYYCLEPRYDEMRSLSDSHSSRGSLTTKLLASMPVILPTQKLVVNFDKVIKSMLVQQIKNLKEIKILTDTRDALLPKLISGDIDVSTLASETEYEYSTE